MSSVTVRNLPEATHRALKQRAAQHGRSTEAEIRHILEAAVRPGKGLGSALAAVGRDEVVARWIALLPAERRDRDTWLLHWDALARFGREPLAARRLMEAAHARSVEAGDGAAAFATWAALVWMYSFDWGEMISLDRWIERFSELRRRFTAPPPGPIELATASAWFAVLAFRAPDHPDMPAALANTVVAIDGTVV